jgi:hypothetical protein
MLVYDNLFQAKIKMSKNESDEGKDPVMNDPFR